MTSDDDLSRRLTDQVDSATPPVAPPFDGVLDRHARGRRRRRAALAAGSVVSVLAITAVGVGVATRDDDRSGDVDVIDTASPSPSDPERPEPTYEWSNEPSPVVLRLDERDVVLDPWTYCWSGPAGPDGTSSGACVDGFARTPDLDRVGSPRAIDFWFGVPGWNFQATFVELDSDCPRHHTVRAEVTGDQTFRLEPTGPAGRYRVDLFGRGSDDGAAGPGGDVAASFVWTTPESGPIEQPEGYLALVTDDGPRYTSYGVELGISDLGFQPEESTATVIVTSATGESAKFHPARERGGNGDCYAEGSLFFSDRDMDAVAEQVAALGEGPFDYRVVLTIDGRQYVGTAVWPRDEKRDEAPNTTLTFDPPLPAYTGD